MNIAIITARGGSKSISLKNIYPVKGKPLVYYPIKAAKDAKLVNKIILDTDDQKIADIGLEYGCEIFWRPKELCEDDTNHGDVIKHDVLKAYKKYPDLKNVVLLLGNTVMTNGKLIDESLSILDNEPETDSVMSVWEAADDHPYRALQINKNGFLEAFGSSQEVSTNRQSYPKVYFYDQSVWTFRQKCVESKKGPRPWWWMGEKSKPIIRTWVTGRDIHTHFDISVAEMWLDSNYK